MSKHTPGPWTALNNGPLIVTDPEPDGQRSVIAITSIKNSYRFAAEIASLEDAANARLIAAAPDLLAAAKNLIEGGNIDNGAYWTVDHGDIDRPKEAIKKAEGKENNESS